MCSVDAFEPWCVVALDYIVFGVPLTWVISRRKEYSSPRNHGTLLPTSDSEKQLAMTLILIYFIIVCLFILP